MKSHHKVLIEPYAGSTINQGAEEAVAHAKMFNQECFLRFNGFTYRVSPSATEEHVLKAYHLWCVEQSLFYKVKDLIALWEQYTKETKGYFL